jgi:predicted metal-dependent hydrolase
MLESHRADAANSRPGRKAARPASVAVKPRNVHFGLEHGVPRNWMDDDPFMTHFMNALSITFPPGERMFMDAVRAVRDRVKNPGTLEDIQGFLAQEAIHSREHADMNGALEKMGYPARKLEAYLRASIQDRHGKRDERGDLAATVALEHITAILGHKLLSQPEVQELFHADVLPIWMWHAVEEMEHKGVAFDVYDEVFGEYAPRAIALLLTTIGLFATAHAFQYQFLKRDGLAHKPSVWLKGLWRMWGKNGLLIDLIPVWFDYFRRDFHPWQNDDSKLVAAYKRRYESDRAA